MSTPRFIVLEGATRAAVDAAVAELTAGGAVAGPGWRPLRGRASVCVDRVTSAEEAGHAVLAAVAGAGLVIEAAAPREVIDRLCDDLRRLGAVDHRFGPSAPPTLSGDERALLAELLAGVTLGEAARALHLSRRTADRRLAAARAALGAGTTAEALRRAAELGVEPAR